MAKQNSTTFAILYARFSDRPDSKTSQSNKRQLDIARDYCKKHDYTIARTPFRDDAKSGKSRNRSGLRRAIRALKPGYVLVVHSLTRLARDYRLCEFICARVAKRGAFIEIVEDGRRVGTEPMEVCMRQVRAAFDELDRKMIGRRTKDAMLHMLASGYAIGPCAPYGKSVGPEVEVTGGMRRTLIDNPAEQPAIDRILALRNNNGHSLSYRAIARTLDAEGYPCRAEKWNGVLVRNICNRNRR